MNISYNCQRIFNIQKISFIFLLELLIIDLVNDKILNNPDFSILPSSFKCSLRSFQLGLSVVILYLVRICLGKALSLEVACSEELWLTFPVCRSLCQVIEKPFPFFIY